MEMIKIQKKENLKVSSRLLALYIIKKIKKTIDFIDEHNIHIGEVEIYNLLEYVEDLLKQVEIDKNE